ncbi:uncharacterized protein KY384_003173 [Bacidia gigantensis]|uniref:uncharacterized protein n=1 Tax=Bacidia gigantensis TaxID=2732470 RepID=UPI001D05C0E3|nr:uncharacterized protein KY384_003173 [Bacidia gigantensis]KAG8531543.1 hypothetical protein KY384_003173 [Bacidia gigantensis]
MATSSNTLSRELQSFTSMDKDMEAIGAHCQYTHCNQLDFLPFRCESCEGTYCLDHRTESGHECPKAGAWAAQKRQNTPGLRSETHREGKPTLMTGTQCWDPLCKTYINTLTSVGVSCPNCNRQYCLKHRLREDHNCAKLVPIGARPAQAPSQADKAKAALGRLKLWSKEKQSSMLPKPKPSSAATRLVTVNKLKQNAKGDDKVSVENRVYLYVEAEASTTTSKLPKGDYYYSKDWSVGRLLDAAAKSLQVANLNNRVEGEEERLRVFHVEAGRLLGFSEKVGDVCVTGNTVVLLRGVGLGA